MFVYWNTSCFKKYKNLFDIKVYLRLGEPAALFNLPQQGVSCQYSSGYLILKPDQDSPVTHMYKTEDLILEVPQELYELLSDLQKINFKIYKIE